MICDVEELEMRHHVRAQSQGQHTIDCSEEGHGEKGRPRLRKDDSNILACSAFCSVNRMFSALIVYKIGNK